MTSAPTGAAANDGEGASAAVVAARFARLAGMAAALLLVVGVALEVALRLAGIEPQRVIPSATEVDPWTEWAMTPDVRLSEYTVTNAVGLHEDRQISFAKPPGRKRVAVLGSSVTWGLGEWLRDTIPRAAQARLRAAGCKTDVVNFAGIGYSLLNASAELQTKVHQFDPDAVVVVMDLGMATLRYPELDPLARKRKAVVRKLGVLEGWFKRATEYSAVLTALDDGTQVRAAIARWLPPAGKAATTRAPTRITSAEYGLAPLQAVWEAVLESTLDRLERIAARLKAPDPAGAVAVPTWYPSPPPGARATIAAYEAARRKQFASVVAADASFAREMGFALYFVTPYGPYFRASDQELSLFNLYMLKDTAAPLYGGVRPALQREVELLSEVIGQTAPREGARVIDMLAASRAADMASGDFTTDGIHLTAQGNHHLGKLIGERLLADGLCAPRPR